MIGDWTFEDYMSSAKETQALTASVPHTVHVIIDFSRSRSYPTKMLSAGSSLDRNLPPNQGMLLVVQVPPYIRAVFDIMSKLYPKIAENSFEVNSLEEALAKIRQHEAHS